MQVKRCEVQGSTSAPAPAPAPQPVPSPAPVSGPGPLDVSSPTTIVGTGTAASCSETALRSAVGNGGVITFNCGAATATIALTAPLVAPTDKDTTIDGADRIVLDGQDRTQILRAWHGDFRVNDRVLAVQRLTMTRGRDVGTGYVPRNGTSQCAWGYKDGGGGAIYTRDVNLRVWGVTFDANRGPDVGPDVAGGALYVFGAKLPVVVNNSVFRNNTASNGGAAYVNNSLFVLRGVTLDANDAGTSDSGGLKITGATVQASDLVVSNNRASWAGGIGHWSGGPEGAGTAVRVTFTNNLPNDTAGVFPR
jgi:hypothetical protein